MVTVKGINHVTLIVDNLEEACAFYEKELNLKALPAWELDFPAQFYRINDEQQLHLAEWEDKPSYRGHVCLQVDNFSTIYFRMKEQGRIDITPWGKMRRLPDGAMQMFVRDPSNNLVEISSPPGIEVDPAIFADEEHFHDSMFVSNRNDSRGLQSPDATIYHDR